MTTTQIDKAYVLIRNIQSRITLKTKMKKMGWKVELIISVLRFTSIPYSFSMKSDIFVWNVQGAVGSNFHKILKEYFHDFTPSLVILVETRVSEQQANRVIKKIDLPKSHRVVAKGYFGRIWILWKDGVKVEVLVDSFHFIHLRVKFPGMSERVFITGIYGSPKSTTRRKLWDDIHLIAQHTTLPWLLARDFNVMLNDWEKKGRIKVFT